MIRRSPTRVELKLEDLADFDYIQKYEKKKSPTSVPGTVGGISAADAQKFIRQDRIGFRPIRGGAPAGGSAGTGSGTFYSAGTTTTTTTTGSAVAVDVIAGVMTAEASTSTVEVQGGETTVSGGGGGGAAGIEVPNRSVAEMDVSGVDGEVATPSNVNAASNISNVDMSLDLDDSL